MKQARDELVRIDEVGTAHPIGPTASRRMRARTGAYRLLPAPQHVIFMRYTGEDGRRDEEDGAIVRIAGEVTAPGTLTEVIALVTQANWRGELVVLDGPTERSVLFDQGFVIAAHSNVDDEELAHILYRFGAVDHPQHDELASGVAAGKRVADVALELGLVTREKLFEMLRRQIEEIVFATFAVSDGTFFFLDGIDDARIGTRMAISANALLMDGVTRLDEMRYFREKIPSSAHVPERTERAHEPPEGTEEILALINGRVSIEELGRATGSGEFDVTKTVYQLVQSKHVVIRPPRESGGLEAVVELANQILRSLHDAADGAGKLGDLEQALGAFAVGAGVYDILFRGAGPSERGHLDAERVAANAALVAAGHDPENTLKQWLHEYVAFALFTVGSALGSDAEVELNRELGALLTRLRPTA